MFGKTPLRVGLIGPGKLAWSLIPSLQAAGVMVSQLIGRSPETLQTFQAAYHLPHTGTDLATLPSDLDVLLLTVGDSQIGPLVTQLIGHLSPQTWVLHTSGSTPLSMLAPLGPQIGVFYPLQIFTMEKVVDFAQVPLFLELTESHPLWEIAGNISQRVHAMDSPTRLRMHMGAVWAVNFTNYLWKVAADGLPDEVSFEVYGSLIQEHMEKAFQYGPDKTQTGPAIRGDHSTIRQHLRLLQDAPATQALYRILSEAINPNLAFDDG